MISILNSFFLLWNKENELHERPRRKDIYSKNSSNVFSKLKEAFKKNMTFNKSTKEEI